MKTKNIIEGLQILLPYYDDQDGYHNGAEHDVIYAYATDRPVQPADLARLIELGWFQERVDYQDGDVGMQVIDYNPNESWTAYV